MDKILQDNANKMIRLFNILNKKFRWKAPDLSLRFTAYLYTLRAKEFNMESYEEILDHIKKNTGLLSHHRGHQMYTIAALLDIHFDNPKQAFLDLLNIEERMKEAGFSKTPYLAIAAFAVMMTCKLENGKDRVELAFNIYKKIKEKHRWLTSSDDYPVAVLLADKEIEIENIIEEMEECYGKLNEYGFKKGNGLQFLSHLLTFSNEESDKKARRCKEIFEYLKQEKLKVSSQYYGTIGYLALLGNNSEKALREIVEMSQYLKGQKAFKWVGKDMNILIASSLVCDKYLEEEKNKRNLLETGLGLSVQAMIAAQTAALIAASSAVVVTTTASN